MIKHTFIIRLFNVLNIRIFVYNGDFTKFKSERYNNQNKLIKALRLVGKEL